MQPLYGCNYLIKIYTVLQEFALMQPLYFIVFVTTLSRYIKISSRDIMVGVPLVRYSYSFSKLCMLCDIVLVQAYYVSKICIAL